MVPAGDDRLRAAIEPDAGGIPCPEASDHLVRLRQLVTDGQVAGGKVQDARIAAICLSHGVSELWTAGRGFSRFPALRTGNPLVRQGGVTR